MSDAPGIPLPSGLSAQSFDLSRDQGNFDRQSRSTLRLLGLSLLFGAAIALTVSVLEEGLLTGLFVGGVAMAIVAVAVVPYTMYACRPGPDFLRIEGDRLVFLQKGRVFQTLDLRRRRRSLRITTYETKTGEQSTWPHRKGEGIPRGPWISAGVTPGFALSPPALEEVRRALSSHGWREREVTTNLPKETIRSWTYARGRARG